MGQHGQQRAQAIRPCSPCRPFGPVLAHLTTALLLAHLASPTHAAELKVGHPLPSLTLHTWEGERISLDDLRGTPLLIDFWASWCGACGSVLPDLDALATRYASAGLVVVGINVDQSRKKAEAFLAKHLTNPTLRLLHDPRGDLLARFGARGMPALYLVDRTGTVTFTSTGHEAGRLQELEQAVRALLQAE